MELFDRDKTVAFTGHRTYKGERMEALRQTILELHNDGYDTFLCGMAIGFDMAAAECVLELRRQIPALRLVCIIPFEGQQERFSAVERERFQRIVAMANQSITLLPKYDIRAYHNRNDFLVAHSSVIVTYFTGEPGGTAYTVKKGVKEGRQLLNIYLNPQQMLDFL